VIGDEATAPFVITGYQCVSNLHMGPDEVGGRSDPEIAPMIESNQAGLDDHIGKEVQDRIPGGLSERDVKACLVFVQDLSANPFPKLSQLIVARATDQSIGTGELEHQSDLDDVATGYVVEVEVAADGKFDGASVRFPDDESPGSPAAHLDQRQVFEDPNGLAQDTSSDPEALDELRLEAEVRSGRKRPRNDLTTNRVGELFRELEGLLWFTHVGFHVSPDFWAQGEAKPVKTIEKWGVA